jgi:ribonuclease HII
MLFLKDSLPGYSPAASGSTRPAWEAAQMPWHIGVDEAGYGPNLGPFVMTAVACRLPEELQGANLWRVLRSAVRRRRHKTDHRLLIDDSKLVYTSPEGLGGLEAGALAVHRLADSSTPCLQHFLAALGADRAAALPQECWYTGQTALPVGGPLDELAARGESFHVACQKNAIVWAPLRCVVLVPSRFNDLVDRWGSKGAILGHALMELLQTNPGGADDSEPVSLVIDKHGGRNHYAAMLQEAIPEGTVMAQQESAERSVYRVLGGPRPLSFTFQPRADAEHLCVALASMVSKYVRELLMREFNEFWLAKVPGLEPTAGYPGDAKRFYDAIKPVARRMGIEERVLWRSR